MCDNYPHRFSAGQLQKYTENQQWETITASERHRLSKMEGQVWLALYNLLMEPECRRKYEIRPQNRAELLKIRTYLSGE